jgi:hypothetical protein
VTNRERACGRFYSLSDASDGVCVRVCACERWRERGKEWRRCVACAARTLEALSSCGADRESVCVCVCVRERERERERKSESGRVSARVREHERESERERETKRERELARARERARASESEREQVRARERARAREREQARERERERERASERAGARERDSERERESERATPPHLRHPRELPQHLLLPSDALPHDSARGVHLQRTATITTVTNHYHSCQQPPAHTVSRWWLLEGESAAAPHDRARGVHLQRTITSTTVNNIHHNHHHIQSAGGGCWGARQQQPHTIAHAGSTCSARPAHDQRTTSARPAHDQRTTAAGAPPPHTHTPAAQTRAVRRLPTRAGRRLGRRPQ